MDFTDEINELEKITSEDDFIVTKGNVPILFSVPHDIKQHLENGKVKKREPFTKAIALYLTKYCDCYSIVKINNTGIDSNRDNHDDYKKELINIVKEKSENML